MPRRRCRCRYGYRPDRRNFSVPRNTFIAIALILAATLVGGLLLGAILPSRVEVVESAKLPAAPELVWQLLADLDNHPSWRRGITSIERLPDPLGGVVWRESHGAKSLSLRATAMVPTARFAAISTISDAGSHLEWSWEIRPQGRSSVVVLRLAEDHSRRLDRTISWLFRATRREARGWLRDLSSQVQLAVGRTTSALGQPVRDGESSLLKHR